MPEVVSVGCKLPNGLHLDIRADKPKDWKNGDPMPPVTQRITLKGRNEARVIGGDGITENVPKDVFDRWMAEHKDYAPVAKGLIFTHAKTAGVEAMAAERVDLKTGFEPTDPEKPGPGLEKLKAE
jgi:hypothetical protein